MTPKERVLVTGADGMLGSEVMRALAKDPAYEAIPATIATMDVTDLEAVRDMLYKHRPAHIIHCAAFTQVDRAEKQSLSAYQVNAEGTKNIAIFARELEANVVYISTDYVFSGRKGRPYTEEDEPNPINVYGLTKLLGEKYLSVLCPNYKVVRTSWLNGLGGDYQRNFVETMLRISETKSTLSIIHDQTGRPTFTFDLGPMLVTLLSVKVNGVFHVTNSGEATWFEFAKEIFRAAGRDGVTVRPVTSNMFRSAAQRPSFSVLANKRLEEFGIKPLPYWKDSLREYIRRRQTALGARENPKVEGPSPSAMRR